MLETTKAVKTKQPSIYAFRKPLRQSKLYLIVDGSSFPMLEAALKESGLKYCPLADLGEPFARDGMPMIVALERHEFSVWKYLIKNLDDKNSAIGCVSSQNIDAIRRHWKKWYRVQLPEQRGKAMFRFYDPRVLFAFMLTLSAAEARAFMGPNSDMFGYHEGELTVASMTKACAGAKPVAIGVGGFAMSPIQVAAAEDVAIEAHKERLFDYFRVVWGPESEWLSDDELREQIELAEKDAIELINGEGELRDGDISDMALVRVLRPDIMKDSWYWEKAMEKRWQSRTNSMHSRITLEFRSIPEEDYYYYQLARFSYEGFASLDDYTKEIFPDLFLRERD